MKLFLIIYLLYNGTVKSMPGLKSQEYLNGITVSNEIWANDTQYTDTPGPPDHTKYIEMARYVMHNSDWAAIATISNIPKIKGFPFSNVKSVVDGSRENSTGVPYFYMSDRDFTAHDLLYNNHATVLVTLEETKFCEEKQYDPQDPRCTRLMLSGNIIKVDNTTDEYDMAKTALFQRHPAMIHYPPDHNWFVAKLDIILIEMVDWFGGAKSLDVQQYLRYDYTRKYNP